MSGPPHAAAGRASVASKQEEDDETLARTLMVMDQLTTVFGFDATAARQAISMVGPDATACYNFILDAGLGSDQGGPIVPIHHCPHIEAHVKISLEHLDFFDPHTAPCTYFDEDQKPAAKKSAVGRAKTDTSCDSATGCRGKENWLCLECGAVRCSRYENGHALAHWEDAKAAVVVDNNWNTTAHAEGHCIAISLSDLSAWCHVCNAYIEHPALRPFLAKLEAQKFGRVVLTPEDAAKEA